MSPSQYRSPSVLASRDLLYPPSTLSSPAIPLHCVYCRREFNRHVSSVVALSLALVTFVWSQLQLYRPIVLSHCAVLLSVAIGVPLSKIYIFLSLHSQSSSSLLSSHTCSFRRLQTIFITFLIMGDTPRRSARIGSMSATPAYAPQRKNANRRKGAHLPPVPALEAHSYGAAGRPQGVQATQMPMTTGFAAEFGTHRQTDAAPPTTPFSPNAGPSVPESGPSVSASMSRPGTGGHNSSKTYGDVHEGGLGDILILNDRPRVRIPARRVVAPRAQVHAPEPSVSRPPVWRVLLRTVSHATRGLLRAVGHAMRGAVSNISLPPLQWLQWIGLGLLVLLVTWLAASFGPQVRASGQERIGYLFQTLEKSLPEFIRVDKQFWKGGAVPQHMYDAMFPPGRNITDELDWNEFFRKYDERHDNGPGKFCKNPQDLGDRRFCFELRRTAESMERRAFVSRMQQDFSRVERDLQEKITTVQELIMTASKGRDLTNYEAALQSVNYFNPHIGATVDSSTTSPSFAHDQPLLANLYRKMFYKPPNSPMRALTMWHEYGECWSAAQSTSKGMAQLGVRLAQHIFPKRVTVEHIPKKGSADPRTAPRELELWVEVSREKDRVHADDVRLYLKKPECSSPPADGLLWVCLGSFTYDINAPNHVQTFDLDVDLQYMGAPVNRAMIRVISNWGQKTTCLYRMLLQGELADPDNTIVLG